MSARRFTVGAHYGVRVGDAIAMFDQRTWAVAVYAGEHADAIVAGKVRDVEQVPGGGVPGAHLRAAILHLVRDVQAAGYPRLFFRPCSPAVRAMDLRIARRVGAYYEWPTGDVEVFLGFEEAPPRFPARVIAYHGVTEGEPLGKATTPRGLARILAQKAPAAPVFLLPEYGPAVGVDHHAGKVQRFGPPLRRFPQNSASKARIVEWRPSLPVDGHAVCFVEEPLGMARVVLYGATAHAGEWQSPSVADAWRWLETYGTTPEARVVALADRVWREKRG